MRYSESNTHVIITVLTCRFSHFVAEKISFALLNSATTFLIFLLFDA